MMTWAVTNFRERSWNESKKIWEIAGPVILASGSEFSITFVTAAFVGHLGEVEFAPQLCI